MILKIRILLLSALFVIIKIIAVKKEMIITLPKGEVFVQYSNFKKHLGTRLLQHTHLFETSAKTREECGKDCGKHKQCDGFMISVQGTMRCVLVNGSFATNHFYTVINKNFHYYEVHNACSRNPGICEHGSVCFPNLNNNTYHCKWCFQPFYGKHCNETDDLSFANVTIAKDIRLGKNSSCKSLRNHYGFSRGYIHDIHPWRDRRKITVKCYGHRMTITKIEASNTENLNVQTFTSLEPGLNLVGINFRITPAFLNKILKLTRNTKIRFRCTGSDGEQKSISFNANPQAFSVLQYFMGEIHELPDACKTVNDGKSFYTNCSNWINSKWSDDGISNDELLYKNVIRLNDGRSWTASDHNYDCFETPGEYKPWNNYVILID